MGVPDAVDRLAELRGIERSYTDFRGEFRHVPLDSISQILSAFGHDVDDGESLARDADALERERWTRVLPPVVVLRPERFSGVVVTFMLPVPDRVRWEVHCEDDSRVTGEASLSDEALIEERSLGDQNYGRTHVMLPADLPHGYHRLKIYTEPGAVLGECRLIAAPERCYQPESVIDGQRLWGVAAQLYTVRSPRNWGIGDFTDLGELVRQAADVGADLVGLNPLHSLFPADPGLVSPYSPASRLFLNPIYVDPEAIPEYPFCQDARAMVEDEAMQTWLAELREVGDVDYSGVWECKDKVLRLLHAHLVTKGSPERRQAFDAWKERRGTTALRLAEFYAIQEDLVAEGTRGGWPAWPKAFRYPDSDEVSEFCAAHADKVDYHLYLQWIAEDQLAAAEKLARDAGMAIGLYRDLAVGSDGGGVESWSNRELYTRGATIGAPPDPLALQGQDWGIPAFRPDVMVEQEYWPLVELLRRNMGRRGALRIDHVLGYLRLWWVPAGMTSADGTYVYNDLDDMFGILALESHRHHCLIIGEDLGTVPERIKEALPDYGVYSYKVFCFEKRDDGTCKHPGEYPREALVTLATHDMPPVNSIWHGSDLELRESLGLYPTPETLADARDGRRHDRHIFLEALEREGLLPEGATRHPKDSPYMTHALRSALQVYIARTESALMVVQLDDWLGMETPVNIPGTSEEYPNWRRKLDRNIDDIFADPRIRELCERLTAERSG